MAGSEARKEQRAQARIPARLRGGGPVRDATILDMSSRGLLMMAPNPPRRGEIVEVFLGRHVLVGQIRWSNSGHFGVGLQERINIAALMQGDCGPIKVSSASASEGGRRVELTDYLFLLAGGLASIEFLLVALRAWL